MLVLLGTGLYLNSELALFAYVQYTSFSTYTAHRLYKANLEEHPRKERQKFGNSGIVITAKKKAQTLIFKCATLGVERWTSCFTNGLTLVLMFASSGGASAGSTSLSFSVRSALPGCTCSPSTALPV